MELVVKNLSANAGGGRDSGSSPGSGRSPGGGHGNPLHYSCLEKPMDRGAWQVTVHGVTKSQTQTKSLSTAQITIYPPEVSLIFSCLLHPLSQGKRPEIKPRLLGNEQYHFADKHQGNWGEFYTPGGVHLPSVTLSDVPPQAGPALPRAAQPPRSGFLRNGGATIREPEELSCLGLRAAETRSRQSGNWMMEARKSFSDCRFRSHYGKFLWVILIIIWWSKGKKYR